MTNTVTSEGVVVKWLRGHDMKGRSTIVVVALSTLIVLGLFMIFHAENMLMNKNIKFWEGSSLVKICRDGTRIFLLKDGRYIIKEAGITVVKGPTICE